MLPLASNQPVPALTRAARLLGLIAFISGVLLITVLSLGAPVGGGGPPGVDKLHHFIAYASVTLCGLVGLDRGAARRMLWIALFMAALGGAIEIAQGTLTDNRQAEWGDMLANIIGVSAALLVRQPLKLLRI